MKANQWNRIQDLFGELVSLERESRQEILAAECKGDVEMQNILEGMLHSAEESDGEDDQFLSSPLEAAGQPAVPSRIDGYEILEEVGRGGMGVVYRALETSLRREVAIKVLPHSWCQSQRTVDRFHLEARTLARLQHPGIVTIFADGVAGDIHYFAMEFIDGPNLAEVIRAAQAPLGSPSRSGVEPHVSSLDQPVVIAEMMAGAAEALQRAHDAGVVHRDVKPSNLFMTPEGSLKVGDFGLVLDEQDGALSRTGEFGGSPFYMSPEQASGKTQLVGPHTDVYSLGVVLYELLTRRRPFGGDNPVEIMGRVAEGGAPGVRAVAKSAPRDLAIICEVAIAKEPSERYASAAEMALDLRRAMALQPIKARPLPSHVRAIRWAKRHRAALATSLALLVAASLSLALALESRRADSLLEEELNDLVIMAGGWSAEKDTAGAIGHSLGRVGARQSELAPAQRAAFERVTQLVDDASQAAERAGFEQLARIQKARIGTRPWDVQFTELLDAARLIEAAGQLRGDGDATRQVVEAEFSQDWPVRFAPGPDENTAGDFDPESATFSLYLSEIDPLSATIGQAKFIGHDPSAIRTQPGHFCLSVAVEGFATMEFVRLVQFGQPVEAIVVSPRSTRAHLSQMKRIEPVPAVTYERTDAQSPPLYGRDLAIAPYLLDPFEVSNGEYHEFVEAFPDRAPSLWNLSTYTSDLADLPVVGVSLEDATAYAEWRGKRLPTLAELIYAGRGPEGRHFPWTTDKEVEAYLGNCNYTLQNLGSYLPEHGTDQSIRAMYLARYKATAEPVTSHPDAATPSGIYHLLGNAAELTCSLHLIFIDEGEWRTSLDSNFVTGGTWLAASFRRTLANSTSLQNSGNLNPGYRTGFRCALSAD